MKPHRHPTSRRQPNICAIRRGGPKIARNAASATIRTTSRIVVVAGSRGSFGRARRRSREGFTHDDGCGARPVAAADSSRTARRPCRSRSGIKGERGRVVLIHLEEHRLRPGIGGLAQTLGEQRPADAPAAPCGSTAMVRISASSAATRDKTKPRNAPLTGSSAAAASVVGRAMSAAISSAGHGCANSAA